MATSNSVAPLPPGWTEHKAPTGTTRNSFLYKSANHFEGHSYFYNSETKKSTYTRPVAQPQVPPPEQYIPSYGSGQFAGGFTNNQFPPNQFAAPQFNGSQFPGPHEHGQGQRGGRGGFGGGRGDIRGGHGHQDRRRQDPMDKPKHRYRLPGCDPWVLVRTKLGRRFVHNLDTKESLWKFPEDIMKAVIEYDRREREKKERRERGEPSEDEDEDAIAAEILAAAEVPGLEPERAAMVPVKPDEAAEDSSEYEEIEVTDDEEDENGEGPSKRQKTDEPDEQPVDFDEDDIAYQLQAMGEDYGLDPGEYGIEGDWEEGAEGLELTEDDSKALFSELLEDFGVNAYSPWEKIVEDGHIIDDDRYVALPSMKARRECFDEWSRVKIQQIREQREKESKKDPKIPYFRLLEEFASVKLYWPEFKRKYRKEQALRDTKVPDREKEKLYREHVKRLQLPQSTLKSDLSSLLKLQPLAALNRSTPVAALPPPILTDLRYISLPPKTRDPLIEAYISTLPPAPKDGPSIEDEEAEAARWRDRERRENALAEREKRVRDEKRRQEKGLAYGKGRLREEEMELQRAMEVGKDGLRGQLEQLGEDETQEDKAAE
jgi:hypothetical protein